MPVADLKFARKKLKNGLEVVVSSLSESPTITMLVIFKVGSRFEPAKLSGISHFVEHVLFKGNKKYKTPKEVAAVIDSVGGSFNAFTSKEYTGFHIKVGAEFARLALGWLGSLVVSPLIPKKDIDPERNVILEEINMYNDAPARRVDDLFERLLFTGSSLGRNVIGTKESLSRVGDKELREYYENHYTSDNAVLAIAGNLSELQKGKNDNRITPKLEQEIIKNFNFKNHFESKINSPSLNGSQDKKVTVKYKKTDQTHLILGARTFSYLDKRRYPLALISTIMGSGMSSWAFSEIREKRGLAYYVHSLVQLHQDVGYYSINAGLNNDKISSAITEISKLFERIRTKPVSSDELKKAKDQVIGGMLLERETSGDVAFLMGSEIVSRGDIIPFSEEIKIIRGIGRDDLKRISEEFFAPEKLRLACIGPWRKKDEARFSKLLK